MCGLEAQAKAKAAGKTFSREKCRASVLPSFVNHSMRWTNIEYLQFLQILKDECPKTGVTPLFTQETRITDTQAKNRFCKIYKTHLNLLTGAGQIAEKGFKNLAPHSVIVTAAGNDNTKHRLTPVYKSKAKASKDFDVIIIGSLAPGGGVSEFSQHGEEVHILAPSDKYILSADNQGVLRQFSGTSGAAPLVTGGLAAFEWISGYHPTAKEAKILLEKTAVPHSPPPAGKSGKGVLNSYKLGVTAKRLKKLCGSDSQCFKQKIREPDTYKFPEDHELPEILDKVFPKCSRKTCAPPGGGGADFDSASCADKSAVFKRLRKAALLNPSNKELQRQLSCIYAVAGFTKNSEHYLSFYKSVAAAEAEAAARSRRPHPTKFCRTDKDCALTPVCDSSGKFETFEVVNQVKAETDFIQRIIDSQSGGGGSGAQCLREGAAGKDHSCRGKCRCDRKETVFSQTDPEAQPEQEAGVEYESLCFNFKCLLDDRPIETQESGGSQPFSADKGDSGAGAPGAKTSGSQGLE